MSAFANQPPGTEPIKPKRSRLWQYQLLIVFAHMTSIAVILAAWAGRAANSVVVGIACFAIAWAVSAHIAWSLRRLFD